MQLVQPRQSEGEQLELILIAFTKRLEVPVEDDFTVIELDAELAFRKVLVSDLQLDACLQAAGDAAQGDCADDGDDKVHGNHNAQDRGVEREGDLSSEK